MSRRVALFIDGPNLYATCKELGIDIDYQRLKKYYGSDLVRAYYYTATVEDSKDEYSSIKPLIDWLSYNGFTVVTKLAKTFINSDGRMKVKGNMDCELIVDAIELASSNGMTEAVFFTGDGDFVAMLLALQRRGIRNTVVSTIKTQPPMCADELRRAADEFIDMVDFGKVLHRERPEEPVARRPSRYG